MTRLAGVFVEVSYQIILTLDFQVDYSDVFIKESQWTKNVRSSIAISVQKRNSPGLREIYFCDARVSQWQWLV